MRKGTKTQKIKGLDWNTEKGFHLSTFDVDFEKMTMTHEDGRRVKLYRVPLAASEPINHQRNTRPLTTEVQNSEAQCFLDRKGLAEYLQIKLPTVNKYVRLGIIPHKKVNGRIVRFNLAEINKWINDQSRVPRRVKLKYELRLPKP